MNALLEIIFEYFGWLFSKKADGNLEKGEYKQANIYLTLFLILLIGVFLFIVYTFFRWILS